LAGGIRRRGLEFGAAIHFEEESALAGAPRLIPFGIKMVAPVIMTFGSAAQQQRYLPKISAGEEWWCQGYSEPGAGSDLASLKTRAVRDGDAYIVNGQKTWNTLGQYADWIFAWCAPRAAARSRRASRSC
jgi:alkylation response protein AidB-like acyl-CoA dehydrogenase